MNVSRYFPLHKGGVLPKGEPGKGGIALIGALKILALPKKGGGSDPCQDFLVDL